MTTLVTGGAGFIGSHLTESLLSSGEDVIIVDDLSTGSEHNLAALLEHPSLRFVKGSILDVPLLDELVSQVHSIYHLAAAVGTFTILDKTLDSLRTNLHGTENILDSRGPARRARPGRFHQRGLRQEHQDRAEQRTTTGSPAPP